MKRIILALTLSVALAGCATIQAIETAVELGTASIANPVTKTRLNQMEKAVILVFAGLNTWKDLCARGQINVECKDQIGEAQVYTRQIPPYLTQLRVFVKTNDQVNAALVFNSVIDIIGTVKAKAAAGGVAIKTTVGS
jgi:hypothetical protein